MLENLQNYGLTNADVTLVVLRHAPLVLLVCDFFANRIYLPVTMITNYCIMVYSFAALMLLIRADIEDVYPMPELQYFGI